MVLACPLWWSYTSLLYPRHMPLLTILRYRHNFPRVFRSRGKRERSCFNACKHFECVKPAVEIWTWWRRSNFDADGSTNLKARCCAKQSRNWGCKQPLLLSVWWLASCLPHRCDVSATSRRLSKNPPPSPFFWGGLLQLTNGSKLQFSTIWWESSYISV